MRDLRARCDETRIRKILLRKSTLILVCNVTGLITTFLFLHYAFDVRLRDTFYVCIVYRHTKFNYKLLKRNV